MVLAPTDVLIQFDYEPTFYRPEAFYAYGRLPVFTLLADGTVVYIDSGEPREYDDEQIVQAQLSPAQTQRMVRRVLDAGFERLQSYTNDCMTHADGTESCVSDASYSLLRVRMPDGRLREVKNYAEYANDPAALKWIVDLLAMYRADDAQPYQPTSATLFLRSVTSPYDVEIYDWPLDPAWLTLPASDNYQWARVLSGDDLDTMIKTTQRNYGDFYFRDDGALYNAYVIPWLPGVDYTDRIRSYQPDKGFHMR